MTAGPATPDEAPAGPVPAVLALGSNLGDRLATLRSALAALDATPGLRVVGASGVVETDPVGPEQPDYLNAVLLVRTALSAHDLLAACQRVEDDHGRVRTVRWGARTLDVDVLDYAGAVLASDRLEVPHPRAHERAFVLVPWADADADAVVPGAGGPRRAADLLAGLDPADVAGVRPRPDLILDVPADHPEDRR